jgi:hypothetical protein
MAYVRCDKDCNPTVQPGNINVIDTFGNSNDFFHVDYEKKDKDNNVIAYFDPNVPQNNLRPFDTTVLPNGRGGILFFDTNWTRRLSDNSAGVKNQYVQGLYFPLGGTYPPGHPDVGSGTYNVGPNDRYSSSDLLEPVYLATESDDDLRIVDEANDDIFVISYTEIIGVDDEGGTIGQLLINEEGDYEVTNEIGNPIEL